MMSDGDLSGAERWAFLIHIPEPTHPTWSPVGIFPESQMISSSLIPWWGIGNWGRSSKLEIYGPRSLSSSLYFGSWKGLVSPGNKGKRILA